MFACLAMAIHMYPDEFVNNGALYRVNVEVQRCKYKYRCGNGQSSIEGVQGHPPRLHLLGTTADQRRYLPQGR